jgi:ABC-2 type transport system ATP-binding protein/lipopolysaccharide transport system ATP-binding protein
MYLRLAFAVAAHLEPDILIVDEVLAVGDAEFQRKCMTRMSSAEREGRTVIFVSHDLDSLSRLCRRSLWLESGRVRDDGTTEQIVRDYLTAGFVPSVVSHEGLSVSGGPVSLQGVAVRSTVGQAGQALLRDDPLCISVDLAVSEEQLGLDIAVYLTNARGVRVLDEVLSDSLAERFRPGSHQVTLDLPPVLNVGQYAVGVWIGTATTTVVDEPAVTTFELIGSDRGRLDRAVVLDLAFRRTG